MLLVIMTKSLIRLDNTVSASLNNDCMTNSHDDRCGRVRTETDRDSHAEKTRLAGIPFNTKLTPLHPLPNQSKPIVSTPSLSTPSLSTPSLSTPSLSLLYLLFLSYNF